ncbi:hypothetical protein H4R18_000624 [Coemansia javaensis]|uniref:Uncharacterized protein n=1 Tax=Coemansia javaensis TaxID=2761396 RepID=A0A9W8HKN1_9FUNG|nr:hypothetical protein H4R18_000624 [Coemansia javaensis]
MKFATASTVLALAAAAAAQGPGPVGVSSAGRPIAFPEAARPSAMPAMPTMSTAALLARLRSYFDLGHVSQSITTMPAMVAHVFDPASSKVAVLAASVMRTGDAYYLAACPVSEIASAGASPAAAQSADCSYGIQLTPVPSNAAAGLRRVWRTLFRAIMSTSQPEMPQPGMPAMGQPAMPAIMS